MKNIDLAKKLVCTETEKDLISVLKEAGYWEIGRASCRERV